MNLFALALIGSYYASNVNGSEFCFGKSKVLKNGNVETPGWCGYLTLLGKDLCEKSYAQVGSNPAKQCVYNLATKRCIGGDLCAALPATTTGTATISTTTSATEISTTIPTSTSTTTPTSTSTTTSTTAKKSTTMPTSTSTADPTTTPRTTTTTILGTTLASKLTTKLEAITTIASSSSVSATSAVTIPRKTIAATITISSKPTAMATSDTLPSSTLASTVDTLSPQDLTSITTTASSTILLRRTTFPTTDELIPLELPAVKKRKKFDLLMFIVVASVVFVGAALCVVAVVLVAMLARKLHQNKSMRTSQPKSPIPQIATAQSLKERPSLIVSDESYDEPVLHSKKPRSSTGKCSSSSRGYYRKNQYPRT